jgi:predicted ATPase
MARLVTLTGPGGVGKTRLALRVAADLLDHFADGIFFVALAPISDPGLVPAAIAQTLGVPEAAGRPLLETLQGFLQDKALLLVLDNFEQVVEAGPLVAELLAAGPRLKILVTSRAVLNVSGEHDRVVPPLTLPTLDASAPECLEQSQAVRLFVERARAAKADFAVTQENGPAVAEICRRLDGLPLAIELAATRVRILPPRAILARLERRLPLLTGGARDLPARQQTLRDTLAWSYDLLDAGERALFRRLSIFVGGCTLEAAAVVDAQDGCLGRDVLEGVASLVANSLLHQVEGPEDEPRFRMLETVREYGLEQLEASGEAAATRRAHAAFFLTFAEEAQPRLLGHEQIAWLRRLDGEYGNLRVILGSSQTGEVGGDVGLRLAGVLDWFWAFRGMISEGRQWADAMLARSGAVACAVAQARALSTACILASRQADYAASQSFGRASVALFREVGDALGLGRALVRQALAEQGAGDTPLAQSLIEESIALAQAVGDRWGLAYALGHLGVVTQSIGDYRTSCTLREKSATIAREIGDRYTLGFALAGLGSLARARGAHAESLALLKEALAVSSELENTLIMPRVLAGLVGSAGLAADYTRAARLVGAVDALWDATGSRDLPVWRVMFDQDVMNVRTALGEELFTAAWAEGRGMGLEQTIKEVLGITHPAENGG